MKYIFVALCLFSLSASAQYRESGDTIFINDHILLPGDTVHLGLGSDPYKNFVFVTENPTIFNASVSSNGVSVPVMPSNYSYSFLIYKGMSYHGKKQLKYGGYPLFLLNGIDKRASQYLINFIPAIGSKEILL